jgi:hypothetical protein
LRPISIGYPQHLSHFTKKSFGPTQNSRGLFAGTAFAPFQVDADNLFPEKIKAPVPKLAGLWIIGRPNLRFTNSPAFSFSGHAILIGERCRVSERF